MKIDLGSNGSQKLNFFSCYVFLLILFKNNKLKWFFFTGQQKMDFLFIVFAIKAREIAVFPAVASTIYSPSNFPFFWASFKIKEAALSLIEEQTPFHSN